MMTLNWERKSEIGLLRAWVTTAWELRSPSIWGPYLRQEALAFESSALFAFIGGAVCALCYILIRSAFVVHDSIVAYSGWDSLAVQGKRLDFFVHLLIPITVIPVVFVSLVFLWAYIAYFYLNSGPTRVSFSEIFRISAYVMGVRTPLLFLELEVIVILIFLGTAPGKAALMTDDLMWRHLARFSSVLFLHLPTLMFLASFSLAKPLRAVFEVRGPHEWIAAIGPIIVVLLLMLPFGILFSAVEMS